MSYRVTLIPGDGTGPELVAAATRAIEATGVPIEWEEHHAGIEVMAQAGTPLPPSVLDSIRRNRVALKGPITTPIGTGIRSVNVALRQELKLYACLRPCKLYPGVLSPFKQVDLVIVRENTEDLYAGVEFDLNTPEAVQIAAMGKGKIRPDSAISIKPISVTGTRQIAKFAFEHAVQHKRRKVTAITKANIMKFTDGLFFRVAAEVAKDYEGRIEYEQILVDDMCRRLVTRPQDYDVLVLPNLYGDIISDLAAGLVGGLGVAPGANIGEGCAVFEATHGSAPRYKGLNKVNPTALILSGMLMLRHLGEREAADRLEAAVAVVLSEGREVTYDLKPSRDDASAIGTQEMADAIIRRLRGAKS